MLYAMRFGIMTIMAAAFSNGLSASAPDLAASAQEALLSTMRPAIFPHIYNVIVPTENPCKSVFSQYQITDEPDKNLKVFFRIDWTKVTSVDLVSGDDQNDIWWKNWISVNLDDTSFVPLKVARDQIPSAIAAANTLKDICREQQKSG
jgi:hypothetical protein